MATLYELNAALANFDLEVDEDTGEILNADELDRLEMARGEKIENLALWVKNLAADTEAYKREKEAFAAKEKAARNKAERLKEYLASALAGERYKSDRVMISWRKSEAVEITDAAAIPAAFLVAQEPKIDKAGIKQALKSGALIAGARLETKQNMQIK